MKKKGLLKSILLIVFFSFIIGCSAASKLSTDSPIGQDHYKFKKSVVMDLNLDYLLFLPDNYNQKESFPLILFLHGAGERGNDIEKVKTHGPPKIVQDNSDFPFIVVSPQCLENDWWTSKMNTAALINLLDEIVDNYKVDDKRIYLTGLSMGGYGSWNLASLYPDRFAAVAPVCGGGDTTKADILKNIPIWVFHGRQDQVVPVAQSEVMVDAIRKKGGNIKFTVYPEADHDSWTETYANQELYDWFLSNVK